MYYLAKIGSRSEVGLAVGLIGLNNEVPACLLTIIHPGHVVLPVTRPQACDALIRAAEWHTPWRILEATGSHPGTCTMFPWEFYALLLLLPS